MTLNYRNAFAEVYEIINYLEDNDYNKIPEEILKVIEEERNKEYTYFIDESIPFVEQEMLPETKAILFNFFRDYFSTQEQKEKILNFQKNEREKLEEKKKIEYGEIDNIFNNSRVDNRKETIVESKLVDIRELPWYEKIYNKIISLIRGNKI